MITVTEKALLKIEEYLSKDADALGLRVGVQGGGCSGFQYIFELVHSKNDTDKKIDLNGITIYIDKKSYIFLAGTEIDYTEDLMASGFKFNNPSANRTCGCGESFGV